MFLRIGVFLEDPLGCLRLLCHLPRRWFVSRWLVQGVGHWHSLGGGERDNPLVTVVVPSLALMSSLFHSYEWVRTYIGFTASAANVTLVPGGDPQVYATGSYLV